MSLRAASRPPLLLRPCLALRLARRPFRAMPPRAASAGAAATAAAAGGPPPRRVVLWFRNDLRLHDHAALADAAAEAARGAQVVPVYCLDPAQLGTTRSGQRRMGAFRALFLLQSLADLRASLRSRLGVELLVLRGAPADALPPLLLPGAGATRVVAHREPAHEEAVAEAAVAAAAAGVGASLTLHWGATLLHPADLPFEVASAMPSVFTPFRTAVEGGARPTQPRKPLPTATLPPGALAPPAAAPPLPAAALAAAAAPLPDLLSLGYSAAEAAAAQSPDLRCGGLRFQGGEAAALARLQDYLWASDAVGTYFDTRNGLLGGSYSTKFSPWLAHGCLSPRAVAAELSRYERERTANKSTYWVRFELLWRDFFAFLFLRHGRAMFHPGGFARAGWAWRGVGAGGAAPGGAPPSATPAQAAAAADFAAWRDGRTGWPFVDAAMRELSATGFMSNRARQNVASFLTQNLGLDWRLGAEHFEASLNDYDVCSNWGNWLFAAGLTGGRINVFNILKQSSDYDADGAFVRAWVPELAKVPVRHVHAPWRMSDEEQRAAGCRIGTDYPAPLPERLRGPASRYMGDGGGGGGRGGGGRRGGGPPGGGGRGGGGGAGQRRGGGPARASEFERYG
jgi:deoxyribodipyrimidine photo-lyase